MRRARSRDRRSRARGRSRNGPWSIFRRRRSRASRSRAKTSHVGSRLARARALAAGSFRALSARASALLDRLGPRARPLAKAVGFACGWALAYAPAAACSCALGAYAGGASAMAASGTLGAYAYARQPTRVAMDVAIGLSLSVLPATLTGASAASPWRRSGATTLEGERTSALGARAGDADAISLIDVAREDFRFDLMGEFHATLPMEDAKYMYKAGAEASGTYCAVPVTHAGWSILDTVPFWYVCDNNWAGHRNCTASYAGEYDQSVGWYGMKSLHDCLRAPVEALDAGATELHFLHLDFQQSFEPKHDISEKALMRASVAHEVSIDLNAPRMYWSPIQEPCCAALASREDGVLLAVTILSALPLAFMMYRDLARVTQGRLAKETIRAFYTRAEILSASDEAVYSKPRAP